MATCRTSTRIGVVADSHVGECLASLPPEVGERLAGVDLILHAGDITDVSVLRHLGDIAPVVAVQGDHDREAGRGSANLKRAARDSRHCLMPGQYGIDVIFWKHGQCEFKDCVSHKMRNRVEKSHR